MSEAAQKEEIEKIAAKGARLEDEVNQVDPLLSEMPWIGLVTYREWYTFQLEQIEAGALIVSS